MAMAAMGASTRGAADSMRVAAGSMVVAPSMAVVATRAVEASKAREAMACVAAVSTQDMRVAARTSVCLEVCMPMVLMLVWELAEISARENRVVRRGWEVVTSMKIGLGQIINIVLPTKTMGATTATVETNSDGCLVVEVVSIMIEIMVSVYKLGEVLVLIFYTKQCKR
jgi:hypothetical protein